MYRGFQRPMPRVTRLLFDAREAAFDSPMIGLCVLLFELAALAALLALVVSYLGRGVDAFRSLAWPGGATPRRSSAPWRWWWTGGSRWPRGSTRWHATIPTDGSARGSAAPSGGPTPGRTGSTPCGPRG